MGISTSPSYIWAALMGLLIGSLLLVAPIVQIMPPLPDPVVAIDPLVLGVLGFVVAALVAFVAYGPDISWARLLGIGVSIVGLALALLIALAGADVLPSVLVAVGSVIALVEIYRAPASGVAR
jgi:hypothetical protein